MVRLLSAAKYTQSTQNCYRDLILIENTREPLFMALYDFVKCNSLLETLWKSLEPLTHDDQAITCTEAWMS